MTSSQNCSGLAQSKPGCGGEGPREFHFSRSANLGPGKGGQLGLPRGGSPQEGVWGVGKAGTAAVCELGLVGREAVQGCPPQGRLRRRLHGKSRTGPGSEPGVSGCRRWGSGAGLTAVRVRITYQEHGESLLDCTGHTTSG